MTDLFAVLDQPRRPHLDLAALKKRYHVLTLTNHPDAAASSAGSAEDTSVLNEAYRVLADPRLRVRHLLELEQIDLAAKQEVPVELADRLWEAGMLSKELDELLQKRAATTSSLAQAVLTQQTIETEARTQPCVDRLQEMHDSALRDLRQLDAAWADNADLQALAQTYQRLSYLARWLDVFREKQFQLRQE